MYVQLDNLCTGLLRQCRRTHVIEGLASVSKTVLPHLRSSYGSATQRHAGGRQREITPREDRFLVVQARHHPFVNATTLGN